MSMTRFRAVWVTQAAVGWAVTPRISDPAGGVFDYGQHVEAGAGQRHGFEEVRGDDGLGLGAQERRPGAARTIRCRIDPGVFEDLPDGRGGDFDPQDEQLAVDAPVSPAGILPSQAQHQRPDRSDR
jgi:hypothetical protein